MLSEAQLSVSCGKEASPFVNDISRRNREDSDKCHLLTGIRTVQRSDRFLRNVMAGVTTAIDVTVSADNVGVVL